MVKGSQERSRAIFGIRVKFLSVSAWNPDDLAITKRSKILNQNRSSRGVNMFNKVTLVIVVVGSFWLLRAGL